MKIPKPLKAVHLLAFSAALSIGFLLHAQSHRHGTDILHFFVRADMSNEGVLTNATGRVEADQNQQGHANNQRLIVLLNHLAATTSYELLATIGDDTNLTAVTEFTSDDHGRVVLNYRRMGSGHGGGLGHGKLALPDVLNPVSHIRELAVAETNGGPIVLSADLTTPDKLQYLIKRDLSTNSVDATLRIKATISQTQFRLTAFGLAPSADYLLALNGTVVQTNSTDMKGRLAINSLLQNPAEILDVHAVALWDGSSNVVVQTTLP
jgi:hypothetical protein